MIRIISLLIILKLSLGLYIQETITMQAFRKEHGWLRLSSMRLQEGVCQLITSLKFNSKKIENTEYALEMVLLDQAHYEMQVKNHCSVHPSSIMNSFGVNLTLSKNNDFQVFQQVQEFDQDTSQRMILILRDCESTLINQYFQSFAELQIEISLTNEDSHLSFDHYFDLLSIPFQIILLFRLISSTLQNQQDDLSSSDLNQSILNLLYLHIISLSLFFTSVTCNIWFGRSPEAIGYVSLGINSSVEVFICLLILNLGFGWKVTMKNQIFASQLLYKLLALIWWIILSILSNSYKGKPSTNYYNLFILFSKIMIFLMVLYGTYRSRNSKDSFSVEFYNRLVLYAFLYLCSGYIEGVFSQLFVIQLRKVIEISFFCLRNSITLLMMAKMFINRHNLYQKVALSQKSFMD